jgi:large subunit ribosomal protein L23
MDKTVVLRPRVSEKAYAQSQAGNVYTFKVSKSANKQVIAAAVQAQFKVTVEDVRTMVIKGKAKRTVRKGGRPIAGRESDFKKAYVTVKKGDNIPIFASLEEAEAKEAKDTKAKKKEKK